MPIKKKINWEKGKLPGIRFYKHENRKHGVKFDRYFSGSYQVKGKRKFLGFGWGSEDWTEFKVWEKIVEFKNNAKSGSGPTTLKEESALMESEKEAKQKKLDQEKKDKKTFGEFFNEIYLPMAEGHKKKYTVKNEQGLFKNWIKPEIGHLPFNKIKPFNLEKIKKNILDAGKAPRTLQYCFAVFRQIWNHARVNDLVFEGSPTRKVKLPKVENKRVRFLTHGESESLLKELHSKSQQVHDMAVFSLHTGVRAGEIFSLTWGVVDLVNGSVLIRDAKGKPRHIYLTEETKKMFERLHDEQAASEFVFKDRDGQQVKFISKTFERVVKKLGFNEGVDDDRDKVLFHTCRHTFASWHVQNGTDLYTVKELLGHSTIQLTERYSHLRPDGLKQTAKAFNNIITRSKKKNKKTDEKKVVNIKQ
jgi:integrase